MLFKHQQFPFGSLLQALKHPCTPQTGTAWDITNVAVLFEFLGLYVIAWGQAAVGTARIVIAGNLGPE